jgi:hypothetical protein
MFMSVACRSHLNTIAKSNEMTPRDAIMVTRCKRPLLHMRCGIFPKSCKPGGVEHQEEEAQREDTPRK